MYIEENENEKTNISWITFEPKERPDLVKKTLEVCALISKDDIKLAENYSEKRFDMENQIAISLGFIKDECVSLATLYYRKMFGEKVLRTMNRYWRKKSVRVQKGMIPPTSNISSFDIIPKHLEIAKKKGFECLFISRQEEASKYFRWLSLKLNKVTGYEWLYTNEKVQVCNPETEYACCQYIIYCSLDNITIPKPLIIKND